MQAAIVEKTRVPLLAAFLTCAWHTLPTMVEASEDESTTTGSSCTEEASAESHATPDFGDQVSTLTFFLYITIFLSLSIQYLREFLHHKTTNYPHIREVLEGVYEELSSVGVTSFLLFMLETSTLPQVLADRMEAGSAHSYTAVFHEVHMALFFIVFLFLLTVIVVQLYGKQISKWWYIYESRKLEENLTDFAHINDRRKASKLPAWLFDLVHHNRVVEVNDALAFTIIKTRFLTQYAGKGGIPSNFSFARYLHLCLNELSVQSVRLHWSIWLFTLIVIGINWIRYKVIAVSSSTGSVILMITGMFSTSVFLFLFWKGRQIRRKLLDERNFLDPRFFAKLSKVATIKPISLYEDYIHEQADFARLLTFNTQLKNPQDLVVDRERREQEQQVLVTSVEGVESASPINAKTAPGSLALTIEPSPTNANNDNRLSVNTGRAPSLSRKASRQIFTDRRISMAQHGAGVGASAIAGQPDDLPVRPNDVADNPSGVQRGASFVSLNSRNISGLSPMHAAQNPLSPIRGSVAAAARGSGMNGSASSGALGLGLGSPSNRPGLGMRQVSSLAHLVSHKMIMSHPQQRKPGATSIYAPQGEAARAAGKVGVQGEKEVHNPNEQQKLHVRRPSSRGAELSRPRSASKSILGASLPATPAGTASFGKKAAFGTPAGQQSLQAKASALQTEAEYEQAHLKRLALEESAAEKQRIVTEGMPMESHGQGRAHPVGAAAQVPSALDGASSGAGAHHTHHPHHVTDHHGHAHAHGHPAGPQIPEGDELGGEDDPTAAAAASGSSLRPIGTPLTPQFKRGSSRQGQAAGAGAVTVEDEVDAGEDDVLAGSGGEDASPDSDGDAADDEEEWDSEEDEEHMKELQVKQLAMQEYIKEMREDAIRHAKLHCCVSCIPPAGSRSQLEEAFLLSDPGLHLRLFQIIMLFQSTYILASVYYFFQLGRSVQVVFLVFTFVPLTVVSFVFIPKFLRNHTITTSLHSQIRLSVVSDMIEAEQMQREDHHLNSLHVRLQARAISLSEVPIAAFAGEYHSRDRKFGAPGGGASGEVAKSPSPAAGVVSSKEDATPQIQAQPGGGTHVRVASRPEPPVPLKPNEWSVLVQPATTGNVDATGSTPLMTPSMVAVSPAAVIVEKSAATDGVELTELLPRMKSSSSSSSPVTSVGVSPSVVQPTYQLAATPNAAPTATPAAATSSSATSSTAAAPSGSTSARHARLGSQSVASMLSAYAK